MPARCFRRPCRLLAARRIARALACALLLATASVARAQALPEPVLQALRQARLPAGALGVAVLPATPGWLGRFGPRLLHQADRPMQPASTLKLLTTVVALDRLGPNSRGFTELLTHAPQHGDLLAGDLVLRGGADPELDLPQLWALLLELRQVHGIRTLGGDVVVDRTLFRPARPERAATPFDDRPEFAYNLVPDALQLNSHLLQIEIRSDGAAIQARALPPLPGLVIDAAALRPSDRPCAEWTRDWESPQVDEAADPSAPAATPAEAPGRPGPSDGPSPADAGATPAAMPATLRVRLQGSFPRDCVQRPSLHLVEPMALAERQLRWLWAGLGGTWTGRLREAETPTVPLLTAAEQAARQPPLRAGAAVLAPGVQRGGTLPGQRLLASHQARPWGELLRTMNKQSSNVYSRLLYLQLGLAAAADQPQQPSRALADQAVRQWLAARGIDATGLVLDNGSGLSRDERITPRALAQALQAALRGPWASELLMSLPLAGVDGTLRQRLASGPASGRARLKTGLLRDVASLAGVVPDPQGRPWVLVAFANHPDAAAARPALDALVDWVAGGGLAGAALR